MNKQQLPVYDEAVKRLSEKMHSVADLRAKLLKKGHEPQEVEQALQKLCEEGFLNDQTYAEVYAQNLVNYRSFGYYGIRVKLLQKRLDKDLVDKVIKKIVTPKAEWEIAQKLIAKDRGRKDKKALAQGLRQKGFRTEVIYKVLQQ